jgi:hypothetical protein
MRFVLARQAMGEVVRVKCMMCGREREELQLIESIFEVEDETSSDTLTVCPEECADTIRANSSTLIRDEPYDPFKELSEDG